jgi:hypothetical protein
MQNPKKQSAADAPAHLEPTQAPNVEGQPLSEDDLRTVSGGLDLTDGGSETGVCVF